MGQIMQRINELEDHKDNHIIVHCHHGGRSMQVTQALKSQGFTKCQNLAGGIDDWSVKIDSEIARY